MIKTVGFYHGALVDSYEEQANAQGYTLGEDAERVQRIGDGVVEAWFYGCISDAEYDRILDRFQRKVLIPSLEKMKED